MTAAATRETVGSLAQLVLDASARHGGVALRVPDGDGWQETRFAELATIARELAAGLIALGVQPRDRVAILGDTRPEWTIADAGALCAGAVVVPVYRTSSPEECRYVLGHSGATAVICEGADQVAKVRGVAGDLPELAHVLAMEPVPGVESLDELRARGRAAGQDGVEHALGAVGPGDVATVVYTSGTTGPPKGCELTHANLLATVRMYEASLALDPDVVIFMFLPLAHALARVVELVALDVGATLSFWSRDPAKLVDDLARARPTHFPSVPRVFEKVHGLAIAAMEDASSLRRKIFHWSLDTGARVRAAERRGAAPGAALRARHRLADRLVLRHVRDLFGGALQLGLTGAAPIGREILEFFDACGVPILEGYGMTESCAAATLNTPRAMRLGSVGRPLPGCDVAIAADGEILLAGPMVFAGYRADGGATAKAVRDGWLLTGDLGSVDTDGFLFITSSGKNITPSNIETALRESRWISEAVVFGDNRPYLVALVTLGEDDLAALAERAGTAPDPAALAAAPGALTAIQEEVDRVNARFARIEQVKRFAVLDHELSQAAGELTPTLKVKRAAVGARYAELIDRLYD